MAMITAFTSIAQSAADFVKKGDAAVLNKKEKQALDYYKKAIAKDKKNDDAYAGASLMYSRIGNRANGKDVKTKLFKAAKAHAMVAVKLDPKNSFNNYTVAVAMGRMALISGSKAKVAASRDIKKYADKAVKLNPRNYQAWNVLGKWNFAVSNLNFAEKAAANVLFGGLPNGDINKAIKAYEKSKSLGPKYVLNYLDLAKAYEQIKKNSLAKKMLQKGLALPNVLQDDATHKKEMKALLSKL
jgi:tetratricopeptide (TPR) repeat protein